MTAERAAGLLIVLGDIIRTRQDAGLPIPPETLAAHRAAARAWDRRPR